MMNKVNQRTQKTTCAKKPSNIFWVEQVVNGMYVPLPSISSLVAMTQMPSELKRLCKRNPILSSTLCYPLKTFSVTLKDHATRNYKPLKVLLNLPQRE